MEKLALDPFLDLSISLEQLLKIYTVCFYCMLKSRAWNYIETKVHTNRFYLILSYFKKEKEVWN